MSKIGDELRGFTNTYDLNSLQNELKRIDAETVELPKDADGMPIHVGDTVWGCISGMQMAVLELRLKDRWTISTDTGFIPKASAVTHVSPDSFERIADELERYANDSCGEDEIDGATASTLVDFADRIRRLAKREAEQ